MPGVCCKPHALDDRRATLMFAAQLAAHIASVLLVALSWPEIEHSCQSVCVNSDLLVGCTFSPDNSNHCRPNVAEDSSLWQTNCSGVSEDFSIVVWNYCVKRSKSLCAAATPKSCHDYCNSQCSDRLSPAFPLLVVASLFCGLPHCLGQEPSPLGSAAEFVINVLSTIGKMFIAQALATPVNDNVVSAFLNSAFVVHGVLLCMADFLTALCSGRRIRRPFGPLILMAIGVIVAVKKHRERVDNSPNEDVACWDFSQASTWSMVLLMSKIAFGGTAILLIIICGFINHPISLSFSFNFTYPRFASGVVCSGTSTLVAAVRLNGLRATCKVGSSTASITPVGP